jgi:hypothetical protein
METSPRQCPGSCASFVSKSPGRFWQLWLDGLDAIEANPWMYPMVEDWPTIEPSIRNYLLPKYGYRIVYRIKGEEILVVAFGRGQRRPGHWIGRITE